MKLSRITTPVGVAKFPWLNEPDTKFESQRNKGGEYHVDLRLPEAESAALVQRLETILQEWMALKNAEQEELKKKPYKPFNTLPWSEDFDDAGNPTGEYVFKFKRGVQWEDRDGNVRTNVLKFVDSHGQGVNSLTDTIGSGSKLRICFQVRGWASPLGVGIALDLVAVQIIELVAYAGSADAEGEGFGFEAIEGGFVAEESDEPVVATDPAADPAPEFADGDF